MPLLRSPYSLILASFAVSRWLYYLAGVRFDAKLLRSNFQFIDLELLRTRLLDPDVPRDDPAWGAQRHRLRDDDFFPHQPGVRPVRELSDVRIPHLAAS